MTRKVKSQKAKGKTTIKNLKVLNFKLYFYLFTFTFLLFNFNCYAKEITILYTGDTHAALYPCHCPVEPDGGVARRATLIRELRKIHPAILVLDSGGFLGGGLTDPATLNAQLDTQRTLINLKAMEIMQYDAAAVGSEEFNFGSKFLEENAANIKIPLLSCNISLDKILPFIIKDISGSRVAIIAVTGASVARKAGNLNISDPKTAVKKAVEQVKQKNADIIVLLSDLDDSEDSELVKDVPGIDIIISGHSGGQKERLMKLGSTLILRPAWQGRRLGNLSLVIKDHKIADYKSDYPRLSDKVKDDPDILSILPACFADSDCRKEGLIASCQNPGSFTSQCHFSEPAKVGLLIVMPKECRVCDIGPTVNYLKKQFPGLVISYAYYPSPQADKLIKDTAAKALPLYLVDKEAEKEKGFNEQFRKVVEEKAGFYMVKPAYSGISYLLVRKMLKGNFDVFLSLYDKNAKEILGAIRELKPTLHFLSVEKNGAFASAKGRQESEENLRSVCVKKYYPSRFFDYLGCRVKNIDSSWWEDCAAGMDAAKIASCAKGSEGAELLRDNISLSQDAEVSSGPTYLLDNFEMFSTEGAPTKEALEKVIKGK